MAMGYASIYLWGCGCLCKPQISTLRLTICFGKVWCYLSINGTSLWYFTFRISTAGIYVTTLPFLCECLYSGKFSLDNFRWGDYYFIADSMLDCEQLRTISTWFEVLSVTTNSSLFLIRVLAVYADSSRKVKIAFTVAWSATLISMTAPFSMGEKQYIPGIPCKAAKLKPICSLGFLATAVFDTVVFIAISARTLKLKLEPNTPLPSSFFHGKGLTHFAKILLRSGQIYYLCV